MKVLQIISGTGVNGALVYCKFLSQQLESRGHDVTVLCRSGSWIGSKENGAGETFAVHHSTFKRFPPAEVKSIAAWVRKEKFDVIHTHMSRGHSFGLLIRMMTGIPVVATAHCRRMQPHWAMNDFVIANSDYTRTFQRNFNRVPERKLETIHCFTDLSRFNEVTPKKLRIVRRQLRLRGDEFVLGVVGDVVPRKGQLYLFRALPEIVRHVPKLKVVMLGRFHRGESYTRKLRRIIQKNKLFCHVKWLGLRPNIQDFMSAFDLVAVPSIEEPLGLVALEAHAGGTAVVAARTGGLPEIVKHEENGLLVPPKNPAALARAVIRMAQDEEFRERMGQVGRQQVNQQFAPDLLTDQVEQVYDRVVARRQAG